MAITDLGSLGAIGSTVNNQPSLLLTTTAAVAVGELVVVVIAVDNPQNGGDAGVASVTNTGTANTWTKAIQICNAVAAQGGASCSLWYTVATAAMSSGATITATFSDATTSDATAMTARHFSVATGNGFAVEGTPGTLLHNTAADPGSLNVTTANISCLRIRGCAAQVGNNTSLTPTASWTAWANGNSATTGTTAEMCARAEHRIVTGTSAASDPTYVSAINANVYVAFKETLPPVTGTMAPSEGNVYELLLHMDGADASTTITDSGGNNRTVTAHGAAQINDGQSVFVGQALMLAADGDYLSVDSGSLAFGTGDFCVDFRVRVSSATDPQVFYDGGASGFVISYDGSALKLISAAGTITGSGLAANTNYHIAATRGAGSTRLWKDGVQQGSTLTDATNYGATSGYPRVGSRALDAATTAWVNAVVANGGTVSTARKGVVDNLISDLKADGVWTKLDRLWLFAAENSQTALTDLKGLALATTSGSPAFSADDGYTFDNTSKCINTGFNPATAGGSYTQNSAHISVWPATPNNWGLMGNYDGAQGIEVTYNVTQWQIFGPNDSTAPVNTGASTTTGLVILTRTASNARGLYVNGSSAYSDAVVSTGIASTSFFVGATSNLGTILHPTAGQIAAASIGAGLNATETANLYTRLRAYMTAVGVP